MKRFFKRIVVTAGAIALSVSFAPSVPAFAYADGDNTYEWKSEDGKQYWYENGVRQGVYGSTGNVFYDDTERGREIYDRESDGWYWLDAVYEGAKAENKEVFMPYIYSNEEENLSDSEWVDSVAALSNKTAENVLADGGEVVDLSAQIRTAILNHGKDGAGKWVRYNAKGKMVKGWYKVQGSDEILYPEQAGNVYYYDRQTGLMAKGDVTIDGVAYSFDPVSGALTSGNAPDIPDTNEGTEENGNTGTDTEETEEESGSKEKTTTSANQMVPGTLYSIGEETVIRGLCVTGNRTGSVEYNTRELTTENIRCIFELDEWATVYLDTDKGTGISLWVIAHDDDAVYDEKTVFSDEMKGFVQVCELQTPEEEEDYWGSFYLHPEEVTAGYYDYVFTYNGKATAKMLTRYYGELELEGKTDAQLDAMIVE